MCNLKIWWQMRESEDEIWRYKKKIKNFPSLLSKRESKASIDKNSTPSGISLGLSLKNFF